MSRTRRSLLRAVSACWIGLSASAGSAQEWAEDQVGPRGLASAWRFEGVDDERLNELVSLITQTLESSYHRVSHPSAPLDEFVEWMQGRVERGFAHGGWPDRQVQVRPEPRSLQILIDTGPRYRSLPLQLVESPLTLAELRKIYDEIKTSAPGRSILDPLFDLSVVGSGPSASRAQSDACRELFSAAGRRDVVCTVSWRREGDFYRPVLTVHMPGHRLQVDAVEFEFPDAEPPPGWTERLQELVADFVGEVIDVHSKKRLRRHLEDRLGGRVEVDHRVDDDDRTVCVVQVFGSEFPEEPLPKPGRAEEILTRFREWLDRRPDSLDWRVEASAKDPEWKVTLLIPGGSPRALQLVFEDTGSGRQIEARVGQKTIDLSYGSHRAQTLHLGFRTGFSLRPGPFGDGSLGLNFLSHLGGASRDTAKLEVLGEIPISVFTRIARTSDLILEDGIATFALPGDGSLQIRSSDGALIRLEAGDEDEPLLVQPVEVSEDMPLEPAQSDEALRGVPGALDALAYLRQSPTQHRVTHAVLASTSFWSRSLTTAVPAQLFESPGDLRRFYSRCLLELRQESLPGGVLDTTCATLLATLAHGDGARDVLSGWLSHSKTGPIQLVLAARFCEAVGAPKPATRYAGLARRTWNRLDAELDAWSREPLVSNAVRGVLGLLEEPDSSELITGLRAEGQNGLADALQEIMDLPPNERPERAFRLLWKGLGGRAWVERTVERLVK